MSYPKKKFKTFKVYEIILDKRWGESMINTFLETVHVQNTYDFMVLPFSSQKTYIYVLSNPLWNFVLFCSVFYCYFDFSKQHFTKDNNEKKTHRRRNETTLYLRLKTCRHFSETRTLNFNQPASQLSILGESRKVTREQHA